MKKLTTKLALLMLTVALIVSGIVLTVSAEDSTETTETATRDNAVATGKIQSLKNINAFSGQRNTSSTDTPSYSDLWESAGTGAYALNTTYDPAVTQFWPSFDENGEVTEVGDSLWFDFEFYYDANVRSTVYIKMRGTLANNNTIQIAGGKVIFQTAYFTDALTASFTSYGWQHIAFKHTQTSVADAEAGTVTDTFKVALYLNGEFKGETTTTSAFTPRLYTSAYDASKPDGVAYSASDSKWDFHFYGSSMFYKTATSSTRSIIRINNAYVSYGSEPRVPYAPINLNSTVAKSLMPNATISAIKENGTTATTVHSSQVTTNPLFPTYDVIEWKNYYDTSSDVSTIKLPTAAFDTASKAIVGWYADADYTQKIDKLDSALADENGAINLYARSYSVSLKKWFMLPGEFENASGDLWQQTFSGTTRQFANGESFNFEFDYYYEEGVTRNDVDIRLRRGVNTAPFRIHGDTVYVNETVFTGVQVNKLDVMTAAHTIEGNGWHHIAINYTQTSDLAAKTHTYVMTLYVDGEKVGSYSPNSTAVPKYWETTNGGWRLYKETVDADGNWTGFEKAHTDTGIYWFVYGAGFYKTANGFYDSSNHILMLRNFYLYYGFVNTLFDANRISYNLNGGSMPTESIDSASSNYFSAAIFYHPFTDGNGNTLLYSYATNNCYYTENATYTLPIPTKMGQTFAGWYTSADFSGDPVTDTYGLSGDITLYAKFVEGEHTATLVLPTEQIVYEKAASVTLPASVAKWIVNGELVDGGTTLELTADLTAYALTVELLEGASVRLNTEKSGIRFETVASDAMLAELEKLGYTYEIGTLITTADLLSGAFTEEALKTAGIAYVSLTTAMDGVKLDSQDGVSTFYASLVNIKRQNFFRSFTASSYISLKQDGVEVCRLYADHNSGANSRTIYQVAKAAYADTATAYTATQLSIMKGYIDGVLEVKFADKNSVRTFSLVKPTTAHSYASPYTVSGSGAIADGVTVTVTKPADLELSAIYLTNTATVYTGGWTVSEDGTTVTFFYK